MRDDFAVMICSHGRAEKVSSFDVLRNHGYTGEIIIVIDDEDGQIDLYKEKFDYVEVFCKEEYYQRSDGVINGKQKAILYARNACYDIAKMKGYSYFIEMDDDFTDIRARGVVDGTLKSAKIKNLDDCFENMIELFEHKNVMALSLGVQGDYIGGAESRGAREKVMRACVGGFFLLKTDRRINFLSSMNEDISTSLVYGQKGNLFLRLCNMMALSELIGQNESGMQEAYESISPFARAFIGTVVRPDCMSVRDREKPQIQVSWGNAVPMIINERWKKYA